MGRHRKTDSQRRAERFGELYRVGKAKLGLTEHQICEMLGVTGPTLLARRKDPMKFSLGQLVTLGTAFGWTDAEYMSIIHPEKYAPHVA